MIRWVFLTILSLQCLCAENFISYEFSGGRFGDNLISYLHAKWLSYKYQLPLLYKPFDYSSELILHNREMAYQPHPRFRVMKLDRYRPLPSDFPKGLSYVFVCPYFAEDPSDRWLNPLGYRFNVDWKDPEFRKIAREMISPNRDLQLIVPMAHTINIAIHIREGGGFDTDHTRLYDPLKLPPLPFYLEGFLKVIDLFKDRPMYCYLFTDALEPHRLVNELEKVMPSGLSIRFDFRRENNHFSSNVLEDFFSMFHFDVLIRPQSNYSIVPSFLQDYAVVYSPYNFVRTGTKITVTETTLEKNEELYQNALNRTAPL